jgi:hypothetical protein
VLLFNPGSQEMTNFTQDLFISYAHIDNQPMSADEEGWVSRFHVDIENYLAKRLGERPRIWRDDKLQGNDMFAGEITDRLTGVAVLISVLTPPYLKSDWCTREVAEFCRTAQQSGGITIENKSRIFKVLKTPVDTQESLPSEMKDALGYDFFIYEDEAPVELDAMYGKTYGQAYNLKVAKLAWHISQLLKKLKDDPDDSTPNFKKSTKATIYLAECSYDQKEARGLLEGELQHHGYTVLPDRELPRDEDDYMAAVQSLLERCTLSIHLVGKTYGAVPDGPSEKSVVVLQNELAVKRSKSDALERVIWLPEGTTSDKVSQQAFITALHQDADVQFGADLITGDVETLKASIHTTLRKLEKPELKQLAKQAPDADASKLKIYLIFNEQDRKATVPVRKFLLSEGFGVTIPLFEGGASTVREANQQSMSECDAVILFYGSGDEAWKYTLDNELKKLPGYRGDKPLLGCYTYLAQPTTASKQDLIDMEVKEDNLIDGLVDFSPKAMADFMQTMSATGKAL